MEKRLREEAAALLKDGKVDCIIGYEEGSLKFKTTPLITRDEAEVGHLVINPFIVNNLSCYLTGIEGKAGIVAKGCDSRSIVSLIQDNKVARDDVVIMGIPCPGLVDLGKVERLVGKERDEIEDIQMEGDEVVVKLGEERRKFTKAEVLFDSCLGCKNPTPREYDILLGEGKGSSPIDIAASRQGIEELEKMPPEERWDFWKGEFSRCIRCYACRNVCPACFCERCFVDISLPQWVSPLPRWQDNLIFQLTRMLHVAGRCVDCGECERACPVGIPLRSLAGKMTEIVDELFDYRAGMDKDASPPLTAYEPTDPQDFIR